MIAFATVTSRGSWSRNVPSSSIAEVPIHRIIDLELLDEIDRRVAHDAAVFPAHDPTGSHHFDCLERKQCVDDVQVVGDDGQTEVPGEIAHNLLGRSADVHDQRSMVRNQRRGTPSDCRLALGRESQSGCVGHVGAAMGEHRTSVNTLEQSQAAELVQVPANGLGCDLEVLSQRIDHHCAARTRDFQDFPLSFAEIR